MPPEAHHSNVPWLSTIPPRNPSPIQRRERMAARSASGITSGPQRSAADLDHFDLELSAGRFVGHPVALLAAHQCLAER